MLCWNVYVSKFNSKEIETYNIFTHGRFYTRLCELAKNLRRQLKNGEETIEVEMCKQGGGPYTKKISVRDYFFAEVRSELMYYFWSKCEWEIMITDWPRGEVEKKVDVFQQVEQNWEAFKEYLLDHLKEITPKHAPSRE